MTSKKAENRKMTHKTLQHPLFGISLHNWMRLLENNGGVDCQYVGRAVFISLTSLCLAPVRMLFYMRYKSKINETRISHPPVFIIGHWRSGTTYLHELLSQDPQFCHVSLWNTLLPDSFLILEPFKRFLSNFLPSKRPMDEIEVEMDGPYEDEAALATLGSWSFFHCLHFPKNAEEQYRKSIHFKDLSNEEKEQWKKTYLELIKTVTFANKGKRFLSKNPPNTARITTLLELFPDARFIHIYRNPYKVYVSTKKMRKNVLNALALQNAKDEEIEQQVIENYIRMMECFFEQKKHIRKDRIAEIKYEDLLIDPIAHVKRIYSALNIPGFEDACPELMKYIKKQSAYKTNVYALDKEIIDTVEKNWRFTLNIWKYEPPL